MAADALAGWEVRGSDNPLYPPTSEMVKALGVPVSPLAQCCDDIDGVVEVVEGFARERLETWERLEGLRERSSGAAKARNRVGIE